MSSAAPSDAPVHDVIIMGGGLAGLTLALQLRQRFEDIDVLVLERRAHPVPEACHKVGESSVEIGAHYFQKVLGLEPHLMTKQLKKFGFRFFFSEGRRDIQNVTELGASRPLPTISWQLDRGIFENYLGEEVQRRGMRFLAQTLIRTVALSDDNGTPHAVTWQRPGEDPVTSRARWVIDASGRAGLLKKKLGLARDNAHGAHAVWFRIAEHIHLDDWSDDPEWRARCITPTRWLSTNHLVGKGYWVWLIPLASGSHSVGIVADPRFHPIEEMNTFDKAMAWIEKYQPRLHDDLAAKLEANPKKLQDFAFFRKFSYDCEQVFSAQRWALAGEAGRFLDPFYSPGGDFIAIGNTFITELIERDRAGQSLTAHTQLYEQIFRSFYDSTLTLYQDQYGLFADAELLPTKVFWDYTYYWSVLAPMFFQGRITDLASLSALRTEVGQCQHLNVAVQNLLRAWQDHSTPHNAPVMLDQASVPWFVELNRSLSDAMDTDAFRAKLRDSAKLLRRLATEIADRAEAEAPALDVSVLRAEIENAGGALRGSEALLFPSRRALAQA